MLASATADWRRNGREVGSAARTSERGLGRTSSRPHGRASCCPKSCSPRGARRRRAPHTRRECGARFGEGGEERRQRRVHRIAGCVMRAAGVRSDDHSTVFRSLAGSLRRPDRLAHPAPTVGCMPCCGPLVAGGARTPIVSRSAAKLLRGVRPNGRIEGERKHLAADLLLIMRRLDRDLAVIKTPQCRGTRSPQSRSTSTQGAPCAGCHICRSATAADTRFRAERAYRTRGDEALALGSRLAHIITPSRAQNVTLLRDGTGALSSRSTRSSGHRACARSIRGEVMFCRSERAGHGDPERAF